MLNLVQKLYKNLKFLFPDKTRISLSYFPTGFALIQSFDRKFVTVLRSLFLMEYCSNFVFTILIPINSHIIS